MSLETYDPAAAIDPQVRPQDDLYRHVNGGWLRTFVIPQDRARDGVTRRLHDQAELDVQQIITEAAQVTPGEESHAEAAKIAAVYGSFMDTEAVEQAGTEALAADLAILDEVTDLAGLARAAGRLERAGVGSSFGAFVDNDAADPTRYRVYLAQTGLGLPDEAYYREDSYAQIRAAYVAHVGRMLMLAGVVEPGAAQQAAATVMRVETALAAGHWDNVKDRDAELTFNPTTRAELAALAPAVDFSAWAREVTGADDAILDALIVREPSYLTAMSQVWEQTDLADLLLWQRWHVVHARAAFLTEAIVAENFDFYGRALTGAEQLRERWKRGVAFTEGVLGEAIGRLYVARHFPPSHKQGMDVLVADLIEAYRQSISTLDWMGEETRRKALAKLEAFTPKIGYPDRWRDYSALSVDGADLLGNVRSASAFETDYELNKLGGPIDRDEWFMPPQMVNAYYNPGMNEVVFPAAILQPPFYDADADDAANYGGIGAVIGHEIGHGFDDQGSKYDGQGRLHDWWTETDRAEFDKRTQALIAQYDALSPAQLDGSHHVNGALTIGENIGDLSGLEIAVKAYRIALARQGRTEGPVIDGVSAMQRLFSSYAAAWQLKARDEEVIRQMATDPHSPDEFRCNQVVKNIDEFHEAFGTAPSDGMWMAPQERVRIW